MRAQARTVWTLLRSHLARHVAAWVFVSIASAGMLMLIPAYQQRKVETLEQLQHNSRHICQRLILGLRSGQSTQELAQILNIEQSATTTVLGLALYKRSGTLLVSTGDIEAVAPQHLHARQAWVTQHVGGERQIVIEPLPQPYAYTLILSLDAGHIQPALETYRNRTLVYILLISVFATFTTMGVVSFVIIRPMHRLRNDLLRLGKATEPGQSPATFDAQDVHRNDEIGQIMSAFGAIIGPIYQMANDRLLAEQALQESQERLLLAFQGSGDALWDWNIVTNDVFYADRLFELLGYAPTELGSTMDVWQDRLHADDRDAVLALMQEHLETGTPFITECRLQARGGPYIWVEIQGRAIWDEQGQPIRMAGSFRNVTERKQAEAAMRKSEARFTLAAEGASAGIWDWDLQTDEIYFSPRWKAFLGYDDDELPNCVQTWENSLHPDERSGVLAILKAYLDRSIPNYEVEFRALHKDGTHRWILARGAALWDEAGNPYRMSGSHTDITDLKRRERDLDVIVEGTATQIGDQFFRSCVGHLAKALEVRYALVSEYNPARDRIRTLAFWNNGEYGENFESPLADTPAVKLLKGSSRRYARRVQERFPNDVDLQVLNVESYFGVPIQDSGGQVIGSLVIMDTEPLAAEYDDQALILKIFAARAGAELERKQAEAALAQQLQVATLLEDVTRQIRQSLVPDAIFQTAVDQLGVTFDVNRCVIQSYSTEPMPHLTVVAEYLEPSYPSLLHVEMPIEGNSHIETVLAQDQALASPNVMQDPLMRSVRLMCELMQIKSMLAVRTSSQGQANGLLMLCQCDRIRRWTQSEIELLEAIAAQVGIALAQAQLLEQEQEQSRILTVQNKAMEEAKQEAEIANRAKSDFLANMSHELRTPLNAILGFTQIMARDSSLNSQQHEQVTIINRSGEHLLHLINDILDMSKIEAGHMTLDEDQLDLFELLSTLEHMLSLRAQTKGLSLKFVKADRVPKYIYSDGGKLRQILLNLLGNAIKFTDKGSVTLRLWAECSLCESNGAQLEDAPASNWDSLSATFEEELPPCQLYFEVEDTGPGIAPHEMEHLFEAFVQTETGRKSAEGTGLGLPISRKFVQLMGGNLTAQSTVGQGTVFQFNIQARLAQVMDRVLESSNRPVVGLAPGQPSYRILVVDDQATNRQVMTSLLEPLGFEVQTANDGQQALDCWQAWSPHLIWMDMRMPVIDGYEATQLIKDAWSQVALSQPERPRPVIIALTASVFDQDRGEILESGCDGIVRKPFQAKEIFNVMTQHLGVQYRYEPTETPVTHEQNTVAADAVVVLTSELLAQMPVPWIEQVYDAAIAADEAHILDLLDEIPTTVPSLSAALADAVNNFRLDQIIDVAEATLGATPAPL